MRNLLNFFLIFSPQLFAVAIFWYSGNFQKIFSDRKWWNRYVTDVIPPKIVWTKLIFFFLKCWIEWSTLQSDSVKNFQWYSFPKVDKWAYFRFWRSNTPSSGSNVLPYRVCVRSTQNDEESKKKIGTVIGISEVKDIELQNSTHSIPAYKRKWTAKNMKKIYMNDSVAAKKTINYMYMHVFGRYWPREKEKLRKIFENSNSLVLHVLQCKCNG